MNMFVIVSTYRARAGEEDAIIALHEEWQRSQNVNAALYRSWELLRKIDAPREFISVAQFADEQQAQVATKALEKDAWYGRLVSLVEEGPAQTQCTIAWHLH
jgi:heme-degrading monooxygenase HmoA